MSSMVVTVVSGDTEWRRALEAGLATVGFDPLAIFDDELETPHRGPPPLALLIDAEDDPYDAVELATWLTIILADRCPALICLGEPKGEHDDELFAGRAPRPSDPNELLTELEHLVPRTVGMASGFVARAVPDHDDEATG
ncbi:MAG: hypothetical protein H6719_22825 [Sandaracinaceae bacterium]|nr:hypothetical protein [Sandaracinaceae bacterium]